MSNATEAVIASIADEINELQADSIRRLSDLTRHGYRFINITARKDGREYHFEGDWLANLLNPRLTERQKAFAPEQRRRTMTDDTLVERAWAQAQRASEISRSMAEAKSLRQDSNTERRTDLYMWSTPEQTLEGQLAARITELEAEVARKDAALRGLLLEFVGPYEESWSSVQSARQALGDSQ